MEKGYEDIYSDEAYIEIDFGKPCCYIDLLYVPPHLRGTGEGKRLVKEALAELGSEFHRVRLRSCALGSGDTMPFWKSLGFKPAYYGDVDGGDMEGELDRVMVRGINGHPTPPTEKLTADNCNREMHESAEDREFIAKHVRTAELTL